MAAFSEWLYNTPVSQAIQGHSWIIPAIQSIHIVAIAILMGSAIVLDLKLAGLVARTESAAIVFRRYMPWLWSGLLVLLLTGLVLITGEPARELENWIFWTKMGLVLIAFLLTLIMRVPMLREDLGEQSRVWSLLVKPLGLLAIAIWILIIFCGRWIAYAIV
jgi:hypothetical protein